MLHIDTGVEYITNYVLVYLFVAPITMMIFIDIYRAWNLGLIIEIIRHGTIVIPFMVILIKMLLMHNFRKEAKQLLDEIDRDHYSFNNLKGEYAQIAEDGIKDNLFVEKCWVATVACCTLVFPLMAIFLNLFQLAFSDDAVYYMIHDLNKPFAEPEERYNEPYFEMMFVYMLICSLMYIFNFTGYDGFFQLSINHACIKMRLYCKSLEDALKSSNEDEMHQRIVNVIQEQCRVFEFVDTIQTVFNTWLGIIFTGTMLQICNCMYQITEGLGFDLRYMIFLTGAIIHIYLPCKYAAILKSMSLETSKLFYCSNWENVRASRIRKTIQFMIARAQIPIEITAFNMITFDMELFVSMMQKSYSMFTLLKS